MSELKKCLLRLLGGLPRFSISSIIKRRCALFILICWPTSGVWGQQVVGSYAATTPEASLFALNPAYLNPATAQGAIGVITNPAALASVHKLEFGFAAGLSRSDRGRFNVQLLEATPEYESLNLDSEIRMEEHGGLSAFGIGWRVGKFALGFGLMQPRRAGIRLAASGKKSMVFHFDVDKPITRDMVSDLPVESIPMRWNIAAQTELELTSNPAEVYISALPVFFGAAYRLGSLSLGIGTKYLALSSSQEEATLKASLQATADIVGTPYGVEPVSGRPWSGSVRALTYIEDIPFAAAYRLGLQGSRWSMIAGSSLNLKMFKLGFTVERGFRDALEGSYRIRMSHTAGPPSDPDLSDVSLDVSRLPHVEGHANLSLRDFQKDSLSLAGMGKLKVGGYTGISAGLQLLFLGVYGGAEIPTDPPDLGAAYFGAYIDLPALLVPARIRAGFLHRTDFFWTEDKDVVPLRSVFHITAGTSIRIGLQRLFPPLRPASGVVELQVGIRSSLIPLAFSLVEDDVEGMEDISLPKPIETIGLNLGLRFTL